MENDILFKNETCIFSYRTGGILVHDGKILLQKPQNDDYAIVGGHVAAMETTEQTLKREFEEEIGADILQAVLPSRAACRCGKKVLSGSPSGAILGQTKNRRKVPQANGSESCERFCRAF